MPTMPSTDAVSDPQLSSPTAAQVHQGQLLDYELLLSFLRVGINSLAQFSDTLIWPNPGSPLDQENQTGQRALEALLADADFQALCRENNVSAHYLIVTHKDGTFTYETSDSEDGNQTELSLTGNVKWTALLSPLEKSVVLLGGQIRWDRLASLPRLATFYAIAPWDPLQPDAHQAVIDALEDKLASYRLGLEQDFNILELQRSFSNESRQVFFQDIPITTSQDETQTLNDQFMTGEIKKTIQAFLAEADQSPLTHLSNDILSSATYEQVRAQPTVYLQKILQRPKAEMLGDRLLIAMDWYGAKPGEETSPLIRTRVVASALQIWFKSQIIEYPDRIAGYDLQANSNWGKSYKNIWREFENHLLTSNRASSEKEAIVMARLFLGQFPAEFRVTDIPSDLPYRGSVVWVNFVNGVNLIESTDPKALDRRTFQQLVNLPLQLSEGATQEQSYEVGLARLLPTLDWAVTQGVIPQKRYEEYTQTELGHAVSTLDKYTNDLSNALIKLNEAPPERLSIAKSVVDDYLHVIDFDKPETKDPFWNGHDLAIVPLGYELNSHRVVLEHYSILDVVAEDKLEINKPWSIFKNNGLVTEHSLWIDENRTSRIGGSLLVVENGPLPAVKTLFEQKFNSYLTSLTSAYETLIQNLLASLPFADRQALESGEVRVYSLRKQTIGEEARNETAEMILPLRARFGVILRATYQRQITSYELLPRAGVIRRLEGLASELIGGRETIEQWRVSKSGTVSVSVLRHNDLPFDWQAHSMGTVPEENASCQAIIEQLGDTFHAAPLAASNGQSVPGSLSSDRTQAISKLIATELLLLDPKQLRKAARGETEFERREAQDEKILNIVKIFVPFWGSIEDLASGDRKRLITGVFGLFVDLLSFALPIGKFASGSAQLICNGSRMTLRARIPALASLTKEVSVLTLHALNPLDGVGRLLKATGSGVWKLSKSGIFKVKEIAGKAGHFDFVQSLPQISSAGTWRPLVSGDQLARVRGIDDVPVRNIASTGQANYRLIDPLSSKPYGPSLSTSTGELSLGRSHYSTLEKTDRHVIVELSKNSRIREVLEVDGKTTLFIDEQPYRLKGDVLRRADLMDLDNTYKAIPCRVRRAPGASLCKTSYVAHDPAPTPDIGSFDNAKGWAPWFGDVIYIPATGRAPLRIDAFRAQATLEATMEFQKGIYGRVMVSVRVPGQELVDNFHVGSIIVGAIDGTKHYVFMRLNAGDFYVAERAIGQSVHDILTFRKAETLPVELKNELLVVYTGSLNANNMVRIHGQASVDRALRTMDEIAIPVGGHANPPDTLRLLKVDTSPGEAALFDHSTRMIVRNSTDGAATWSLSKNAPDNVRETTAEIFNNLFGRPVVTVSPPTQAGPKALKIDDTMVQLQKLIRKKTGRPLHSPRNIAFAEIKTKAGAHEVYVSVSGQQGDTGFLPLFAKNRNTNEIAVGNARYFNIDSGTRFPQTALSVTPEGKLQAIPHTIDNIETYTPLLTSRPTSLDTESKLISVIRGKYPDPKELESITIATTMAPCDSCSVVMKQFGYDGSPDALDVIWK